MASSPVGRGRTVCETCELPFYTDNDECPYCGGSKPADTDDGGFVFEGSAEETDTSDGQTETTPSADERSGLFGRLKRTLGL